MISFIHTTTLSACDINISQTIYIHLTRENGGTVFVNNSFKYGSPTCPFASIPTVAVYNAQPLSESLLNALSRELP